MNVFSYWTGPSCPLINMMLRIMKMRCGAEIFDEETIGRAIELPSNFHSLIPAHQADYARVSLVHKYGGIWLDADTLVLDDISQLPYNFLILENNQVLCNGVFGAKKENNLMGAWLKYIKNNPTNGWNSWGSGFLTAKANSNPELFEEFTIYNGLDTIYPVNWDKAKAAYLDAPYETYRTHLRTFQPLLILVNSVYKAVQDKSEQELLDLKCPLGYFLNVAHNI